MLFDFLSLLFSAFLGGLISLGLYKLSERKEENKLRLQELHDLIKITKEIAFEATDLSSKVKILDKETIKASQFFTGHKIQDYIITSPFHAIHIDESIYNKTIIFINFLNAQNNKIGEKRVKPDMFIEKLVSILDEISTNSFELLNFYEDKRSKYLIEFGNKYVKR